MPRVYARRLVRRTKLMGEELEARLCLTEVLFASHEVANGVFRLEGATDLDGDGDIDVLAVTDRINEGIVVWFENTDGKGTFGPQQIISGATGFGRAHASDLDGDGDMDVLSGGSDFFAPGNITWYENTDGKGGFVSRETIGTEAGRVEHLQAVDLDGDQDYDILTASSRWDGSSRADDIIAWYENTDGEGTFGPRQIITSAVGRNGRVHVADLDVDGDMDILYPGAWHENTDGMGSFGPQQRISSGGSSVNTGDIDGDGDVDVASSSTIYFGPPFGHQIVWYENVDGEEHFSVTHVITDDAFGAWLVDLADIDGDGDLDAFSRLDGTYFQRQRGIVWFENVDGNGNFGEKQIVDMANGTSHNQSPFTAHSTFSADVDGDGDVDLLSTFFRGLIRWYENVSAEPGDANRDLVFNQLDIVHVLVSAKYLTGEPATWSEGDWNADGLFDHKDIVAALKTGNYLQGPYAAVDAAITGQGN